MRSIGAAEAIVTFDGSGDSGWAQLYGVKIKGKIWTFGEADPANRVMTEPEIEGMFDHESWQEGRGWVKERQRMTRKMGHVCEMLFDCFTYQYRGWENNNGAHGEVILTLDAVTTKYTDKRRYTGRMRKGRPKSNATTEIRHYQVPMSAMTELVTQLEAK
jgi:hypothetical protein